MDRLHGARHALPGGVLVFFTVFDLAIGPGQVVLGLVVISPLVAASLLGLRATAGYAVLALVAATSLGFYDDQYQPDTAPAQAIRLFGVALGGALALVVCTLRRRSLLEVTRLGAEAAASRSAVQLAETLQRSLLTAPPTVPGLEIAVRYVPAVRHARVGGDWYDAFPGPDGSTVLVLGDVAGHDVSAAATMAQVRGLLRGIACSPVASPAQLLGSLDRALGLVQVDSLVTVAVATVRVGPTGSAVLCWSNAGHPPPLLLCGDGTVHVLERPVDLLLGISCEARRADHELSLGRGDTVLLYSDGLVEHRGTALDEGTAALAQALRTQAGVPLEAMCDALLADVADRLEDDVAVLAVRIGDRGATGVSAWTAGAGPRGRRRSPPSPSAPPARP